MITEDTATPFVVGKTYYMISISNHEVVPIVYHKEWRNYGDMYETRSSAINVLRQLIEWEIARLTQKLHDLE